MILVMMMIMAITKVNTIMSQGAQTAGDDQYKIGVCLYNNNNDLDTI